VNQEPHLPLVVSLEFEEVIAAPKSAQLHQAVSHGQRGQPGLRQRGRVRDAILPRFGILATTSTDRYGPLHTTQDLFSTRWMTNRLTLRPDGNGAHSAADVTADGLGVDQTRGGKGGPDTDLLGEVNVRHDGDVFDILGFNQTVEAPFDL